ncbi:unnamed protein product [Brassica oleracea]
MLALSVKDIRGATGSRRILFFASLNLLHTLRQIGSSAFLCRSSPPPPLPSSSSRLFSSTGRDKKLQGLRVPEYWNPLLLHCRVSVSG